MGKLMLRVFKDLAQIHTDNKKWNQAVFFKSCALGFPEKYI